MLKCKIYAWQSVDNEISLLTLTEINTKTSVKHKILTTMFHGKICSPITGFKSSMQCYICGAKPVEINSSDILAQKTPNLQNFNFGMFTLHG